MTEPKREGVKDGQVGSEGVKDGQVGSEGVCRLLADAATKTFVKTTAN